MLGNGRMEGNMVKGQELTLMEGSMWENSRIGNLMVKEHTLSLTEKKG